MSAWESRMSPSREGSCLASIGVPEILERNSTTLFSGTAAYAYVEDFAGDVGGVERQQVGLHCIFDIGEIAGLFAVAEDHRLRFFQRSVAELGENSGVRRAGILARAEHVEIAQADIFEAVTAAKGLEVKFADILCHAVGRNRSGMHRLDFRERGRFAVSRRGRREYDALRFRVARGHQHIERAVNVDGVRANWILYGARHRRACGEVQHVIGFVHGFPNDFDVGDAALDERDLVAHFSEAFFFARGKIVEDHHAVATFYEFVYRVRAYESGAACYDVTHAKILPKCGR